MKILRILGLLAMIAGGERLHGFDVILDPARVAKLLTEIARLHQEAEPSKGKPEALYEMGEGVLELTEMLTQDLDNHGVNDANLVALIQRRLTALNIKIFNSNGRWQYDLAAFRQYLQRAPRGELVRDARYVLVGFDEPTENPMALQKSIAAKEQFIRDYPKFDDLSIVELLLARQRTLLARLFSAEKKDTLSKQQRAMARQGYERIIRLYPNSEEAQTARAELVAP